VRHLVYFEEEREGVNDEGFCPAGGHQQERRGRMSAQAKSVRRVLVQEMLRSSGP